ncbi:MAG: D-alanyl-D-alanine carboxypeptidase [Ruminococcus sp.]|nr:D-alanyl-D-alanine carboxypeptidase [Ruminococcus sp.]
MKRLLSFICICCILCITLTMPCTAAESAPPVSAKAYLVMEAASRNVIYEGNARTELPMASTTKIMSALLCLESGDLDTEFTVDADAIRVEGSSMGLTEGDIVTKRALCYGMLLPSGNDAAGAAAVRIAGSYAAFADQMNARAAEIGMEQTHFVTPSGLHDEQHYSTAYDMALLTAEALRNDIFREICAQSSAKVCFGNPPFERWLENSNKLLRSCEGVIGVKTGFTDEAGRCLVSACMREGVTLICVTLNDKDDWNDHARLYDAAFSCVTPQTADLPQSITLPVAGGTKDTVPVYAEDAVTYGAVGAAAPVCRWEAEAAPLLYAPVTAGSPVAELVYYCNGFEISRQPLYAAETILYAKQEESGESPFEAFLRKLKALLGIKDNR